jgi:hypothetical protein
LAAVQENCRKILQDARMWPGVTKAAELLCKHWELDGEEIENILNEMRAPNMFDFPQLAPPVMDWREALTNVEGALADWPHPTAR